MEETKKIRDLNKKIDKLLARHPAKSVYASLAETLARHIFEKSGSHFGFMENLKETCDLMTKTINNLEENAFTENPKIKIAVMVEDPDGLYTVV